MNRLSCVRRCLELTHFEEGYVQYLPFEGTEETLNPEDVLLVTDLTCDMLSMLR